jgi:hypothetical protein
MQPTAYCTDAQKNLSLFHLDFEDLLIGTYSLRIVALLFPRLDSVFPFTYRGGSG